MAAISRLESVKQEAARWPPPLTNRLNGAWPERVEDEMIDIDGRGSHLESFSVRLCF
jgi:hypothetical protein